MPKVTRRRAKSDPLMCQKWPWRLKGLYCEGPFISPGFVLACRRARFPIREALTRHKDQTEAEKTCAHTHTIQHQTAKSREKTMPTTEHVLLFSFWGWRWCTPPGPAMKYALATKTHLKTKLLSYYKTKLEFVWICYKLPSNASMYHGDERFKI